MALSHIIRDHVVVWLGEFVGTFLFLFFAFGGTQTANQQTAGAAPSSGPNLQQLLYISLIFGFSLAINVWVFFRISGGLFNPAVTLALCLVGVVSPLRSISIFIAQILGAITAAAAVNGLIPGDDILFDVKLTNGISIAQGLFLETILTAELVFTILMLAAEKTKTTYIAPIGIGLALFIAELVSLYWTGGALNPARAFGPAVLQRSFPSDHWIYWVGPILGALLAAGFYKIMKLLKYEDVNGDQDKAADEESSHSPTSKAEEGSSFQASHRSSRRSERRSFNTPFSPPKERRAQRRHYTPAPAKYSNGRPYVQDMNAQKGRSAGHDMTNVMDRITEDIPYNDL